MVRTGSKFRQFDSSPVTDQATTFNISNYHVGVIRHLLAIKNGNLDISRYRVQDNALSGFVFWHVRVYIYTRIIQMHLHVYFMYMIEVGIMLE